MRIAVGSDHAGYEEPKPYYKPEIERYVQSLGHEVVNCGTDGPDAVDYPDVANKVCETIVSNKAELGVLLCGTGIGMSITANRHPAIRAAVCVTPVMAALAREHNHANVLCLGRRLLSLDACRSIIDAFLATPWSAAERHVRRVGKMG